jgi:hypothetical protein
MIARELPTREEMLARELPIREICAAASLRRRDLPLRVRRAPRRLRRRARSCAFRHAMNATAFRWWDEWLRAWWTIGYVNAHPETELRMRRDRGLPCAIH